MVLRFKLRRLSVRRSTLDRFWSEPNQSTSRRPTASPAGARLRTSLRNSLPAPENFSRSGSTCYMVVLGLPYFHLFFYIFLLECNLYIFEYENLFWWFWFFILFMIRANPSKLWFIFLLMLTFPVVFWSLLIEEVNFSSVWTTRS